MYKEMLGHSSLEQTSTHPNVQRCGIRDSMRKSGESSCCNPVAIAVEAEHPLIRNERTEETANVTVN